ncbi:MAG: IS66 family insertion sequence element accessory protein TnpB [Lachnospiraceae bacterium]|nr:IS66 family insertion sequence element accessory protein TnpB [Lachnospiraceae bacterium]
MLRLSPSAKVYLACGPTDMRNNIDGLLLLIKFRLKLDPFEPAFFVFCNRQKNKLKILFWDKNGYWLYYKRLESERFNWPEKVGNGQSIAVTEQQLSWLLDGLRLDEPDAHKEFLGRKIT